MSDNRSPSHPESIHVGDASTADIAACARASGDVKSHRLQSILTLVIPAALFVLAVVLGRDGLIRAGSESGESAHCAPPTNNSGTQNAFVDYWTGGGAYMPRTHCMVTPAGQTDWPWVVTVITLTGGVVVAYLVIFRMWRRCYFAEEKRDRNRQLMTLAYIFLWCAICGYVMSILSFFWPAYRLLAGALVILNIFSWRFALNSREFQTAFSAKRIQRQLNERLQIHNVQLQQTVDARTGELRKTIAQLAHQAKTDSLTQLPNRAGLTELLVDACRTAEQSKQQVGVIFLDFDRFKYLNDSLGHDAGDALLCEAAHRLQQCAERVAKKGPTAHCARLGGDEFVCLVSPITSLQEVIDFAMDVQSAMSMPFEVLGTQFRTGVSVGVTSSATSTLSADALMRDADLAMYESKSRGRGRTHVFDEKLRETLNRRLLLERELRSAISRNEMAVVYQPIVSLATGKAISFEALLRWTHPTLGPISPTEFIPLAEESNQIERLTAFVLDGILNVASEIQRRFSIRPQFNINVPPLMLRRQDFAADFSAKLAAAGVPASQLCLEITESGFMRDQTDMTAAVARIRSAGMRVAMDDFGTGHSSLASLHEISIDVLKIDRRFISNMTQRRDYAAVVHAITSLARNLGMLVVAEGLENAEQIAQLQALDCELAQGFYFSRPIPAADAIQYIAKDLSGIAAAA